MIADNSSNIATACSDCGFKEKGIVVKIMRFSKNYKEYGYYAANAEEKSLCPQCKKGEINFNVVYSFIFQPDKKSFSFFPSIVDEQNRKVIEDKQSNVLGSEYDIISSRNLAEIKEQAFKSILNLLDISDINQEITKKSYAPKNNIRNKAYHTALYLCTHKEPGFIHVKETPGTTIDQGWSNLKDICKKETGKSFLEVVRPWIEKKLHWIQ